MRARVAWWVYAAAAASLALVTVWNWLWAVTLRGPILYGEGAVAHAAILARDRAEYATAPVGDSIFTAANYPPLYFHLAAIGDDPFVTGRALSVAATLVVAFLIAWRARPAGLLVAATIALAWIASVPVMNWGAAVKPDPVALALTVGAVSLLARERPSHAIAGALLAAAVLAKPTALLPAIALFVYVLRRDPVAALRGLGAGALAMGALFLVTYPPDEAMRLHVIEWNSLPWRPELLAGLVLVALLVLAVPLATMAATRAVGGVLGAYLIGAVGVLLLGGREGATINYFLDLSAALALIVASLAPRLALQRRYPVAAILQLLFAAALLNPFPHSESLMAPTGKWEHAEHIAYVRDFAPGVVLSEDSGLLVADGRDPIVDDLFLWSRLYATARIDGRPLLDAVRAGRFDAILSYHELERLETGPGFARQRWHADLATAVLERYHAPMRVYGLCQPLKWCHEFVVYVRR